MDANIYLRAAERIDSRLDGFACWAILNAGHRSDCEKERFVDLFCPSPETNCFLTGRRSAFFHDPYQTSAKNAEDRVIALLLAYEITKDEALRARQAKNSKAYRARWKWRRLKAGDVIRNRDQYLFRGEWCPALLRGPVTTDAQGQYYRRRERKAAR